MLPPAKQVKDRKSDPRSDNAKSHSIPEGVPIRTSYVSRDVAIPAEFLSLTNPPSDAQPVTIKHVDWATSELSEYDGLYAVVLENVLSPSECETLIELAESSVDVSSVGSGGNQNPWKPAMVNFGGGMEVLETSYRNSDRIVWDRQEVVDRIWQRCLQGEAGEALRKRMDVLDGDEKIGACRFRGRDWVVEKQRWDFRRLNHRMRFLKYGPGQYFRRKSSQPGTTCLTPYIHLHQQGGSPTKYGVEKANRRGCAAHCDGPFSEEVDGKIFRTFFTLHLYLNDSVAEAGESGELVGGATSFLSSDGKRKVDVHPKAGRVLIFQHRQLYHCGDDVVKGTKYTMRTDVMYELIRRQDVEKTEMETETETEENKEEKAAQEN
jgi:hypothetical protein